MAMSSYVEKAHSHLSLNFVRNKKLRVHHAPAALAVEALLSVDAPLKLLC